MTIETNLRKRIMITLSNTDRRNVSRETAVSRIIEPLRCIRIVASEERHRSSERHYHIGIDSEGVSKHVLVKKVRSLFPEFEGAQCNVVCRKSWASICEYVLKEDENPYCWGTTLSEAQSHVKSIKKHIRGPDLIRLLREKESWEEVLEDDTLLSRYVSKNYTSARSLFADLRAMKETPELLGRVHKYILETKGRGYSKDELLEKWEVIKWLAYNLCRRRHLKQKQLVILGPPSTHKSNLVEALSEFLNIYVVPRRKDDFTGARNDYDLWVFEEWGNTKTDVGILKLVLDGQRVSLDTKYGRIFHKTCNVPILCVGNNGPYVDPSEKAALSSRLELVRFESKLPFAITGARLSRTLYPYMRKLVLEEKGEKYVLEQEGVVEQEGISGYLTPLAEMTANRRIDPIMYVGPDTNTLYMGRGGLGKMIKYLPLPIKQTFLPLQTKEKQVLLPLQERRRGRPKRKVYVRIVIDENVYFEEKKKAKRKIAELLNGIAKLGL